MSKEYNSFNKIRESIDESLTDATKCYLLIKYAYSTDEEKKLYIEEFKKRYDNFYKTVKGIENHIDSVFSDGMETQLKGILNLGFYKEKMNFLEIEDLSLEELNQQVDLDFENKTSTSMVKLNFYHNNKVEFGTNTRFHVNTTKYGVIDPKAHNEEEVAYIFNALTSYYINSFTDKDKNIIKKELKKNE